MFEVVCAAAGKQKRRLPKPRPSMIRLIRIGVTSIRLDFFEPPYVCFGFLLQVLQNVNSATDAAHRSCLSNSDLLSCPRHAGTIEICGRAAGNNFGGNSSCPRLG